MGLSLFLFSIFSSRGELEESLAGRTERDEILREDWTTNSDYELGWPGIPGRR